MPLRACGGGGEGICVGAPSAMSSAVSGTEFENTSALTRRSVGCYYPSVNCGPARRCLLRFWFRQKRGCARRRQRGLSCVAMEFYCRVLRSSYVCRAVLSECFALDHAYCRGAVGAFWVGLRLLFDENAKQDGLRYVSFLFRGGRERHSCVLAAVLGYLALLVHFGIGRFFMAIPTEYDRSPFIRKEAPYRVALLSLWRACSL